MSFIYVFLMSLVTAHHSTASANLVFNISIMWRLIDQKQIKKPIGLQRRGEVAL